MRRILIQDGPLAGKTFPCPGHKLVQKVPLSRLNKNAKLGWAWVVYVPVRTEGGWIGILERVYNPKGVPLTRKGVPIILRRKPKVVPTRKYQRVTVTFSKKMLRAMQKAANKKGISSWVREACKLRLRWTP